MFEYSLMIKAFILALAISLGTASTYYFKFKKDNPIEQVAEAVIKEESGVAVDLSPEETISK